MRSIASFFCLSKAKHLSGFEDHAVLASQTAFNVNEVEALYILFEQLSSSIVDDGRIHKEEFLLALFNCTNKKNLLAEKLFELFDLKRNGVIEFGEFVRSLSIFHPNAPEADKVAFAFRLYDLRHTGYIEREELKEMVLATLNESELSLSDEVVEEIVDKAFQEADLNGDGKIDPEEWKELVLKYPSLIKNMTLPYLRELTLAFPGFVMETEEEFKLGLFRDSKKQSLFADRMFDLFDSKHDGVIDFGEFVRSLSIFHPDTPQVEKAIFAFNLYDLWQTGFIEKEEVKEMISELLNESDLILPDDIIEAIIDKTFEEADSEEDGKIDIEEWKDFVVRKPSLLRNMTIPYLKDITNTFPSYVMSSIEEM
ncbi:hypothetical protein RD792_009017 [Penstemon davidsonii]|uniref:Calcineurin B-like protein n=1 Tax=Penstemon davidsonii TaxID=160366 RepID=A0ABR0DAS5_9LAMI|nr:hypothetical protein RD792_009017 [Penstemon davidsonii]